MADARFNRMNNQAPAQTQLDSSDPKVGRSAFDFSFIHSGNTEYGLVAPVDCFDVVPNEDIDIELSALLELRNPLVRNILNGTRVYFHAYINYLVDLWEGAKNFLDAGRSGQISLQRPKLIYHFRSESLGYDANANTPMSLLNFLGLPAEAFPTKNNNQDVPPLRAFQTAVDSSDNKYQYNVLAYSPDYFPADCAFAYQRNWRDYYSNKNLLQNNKRWFPDNEDHFILSYSCENAVALAYENEFFTDGPAGSTQDTRIIGSLLGYQPTTPNVDGRTPEPNNPLSESGDSGAQWYPNLSGIKFRQFKGDRFTTSLPFPDLIRGDIPVLADTGEFSDLIYQSDTDEIGRVRYDIGLSDSREHVYPDMGDNERFLTIRFADSSDESGSVQFKLGSAITMNDIRALETMTVFKERMARTSGDYNDMIEAQYGYNPKHHNRTGEYIGGFYQDFAFSSVVQTSESGSTPLGSKAGQGVSNGQGRIGHVHTRDFGWIQIYMSIVPDVMYTQGIPRMFDKKIQTEMYFPIFNNLAPQAIKNKELFVSGDSATDNDVFAYEDRYAEYKSRTNRVSGFMGLLPTQAAFDASKIMARRFTSTPVLNSQFVTILPENIDMSVFSVTDEPPFDFQVGVAVRRVFPGPYTAIPGSLSSGLHA